MRIVPWVRGIDPGLLEAYEKCLFEPCEAGWMLDHRHAGTSTADVSTPDWPRLRAAINEGVLPGDKPVPRDQRVRVVINAEGVPLKHPEEYLPFWTEFVATIKEERPDAVVGIYGSIAVPFWPRARDGSQKSWRSIQGQDRVEADEDAVRRSRVLSNLCDMPCFVAYDVYPEGSNSP